jgi:hypothetical protein
MFESMEEDGALSEAELRGTGLAVTGQAALRRRPALRKSPLGSILRKRCKQELLGLIEDYQQGLLPLIAPLT